MNLSFKNLLALFLLTLCIYVVIRQVRPKPGTTMIEKQRGKTDTLSESQIPSLNLALLVPTARTTREGGRNIFRYSEPPKTQEQIDLEKQREMQRQQALEAARNQHSKTPTSPPPPSEPPKPKPPAIDFKFLGSFGPRNHMLAVFSNGEEIMDVFEGEVFMEHFIVADIGLESVTVGFVGFPEDEVEIIEVGS